jgi:hypothetical protein
MLYDFFINNFWISIALWVLLSISDSYLTIAGAKLYHSGAKEHFLHSGSYELEPYHQNDVDAFKVISFTFILGIILFGGFLWIIYSSGFTNLFAFAWGGLIFIQVAIHLRHFRNLLLFSYAKRSRGIKGRVEFERWLSLRLSFIDLVGFGLLLLISYMLTGSLMILGGAVGCSLIAINHWRMSRKENSKEKTLDSSRA